MRGTGAGLGFVGLILKITKSGFKTVNMVTLFRFLGAFIRGSPSGPLFVYFIRQRNLFPLIFSSIPCG